MEKIVNKIIKIKENANLEIFLINTYLSRNLYKKAEKKLKKLIKKYPEKEFYIDKELQKIYRKINDKESLLKINLKILKNDKNKKDIELIKEVMELYSNKNKFVDAASFLLKYENVKNLKKNLYRKILKYVHLQNVYNNKNFICKFVNKLLNIIPKEDLKIRNSLLNEKEFANGKLILSSKPRKLQVVLTNKCNLRCVMCDFHEYDWNFNECQINELKSLIPYLEYLIWQGGEVFLNKDFFYLFNLALEYDVKQTIITNGLLINENVAKNIVQNNISLAISIDDVEKEGYEKIRKGGKFENLISNLKLLNSLKHKNKISNFNMQLSVVIMKSNYNKLDKFLDFAKTYGFSSIELNPIKLSNNNYEEQIFFPKSDYDKIEYINSVLPDIYKKATELGININSAIPTLQSEIYKNEKYD